MGRSVAGSHRPRTHHKPPATEKAPPDRSGGAFFCCTWDQAGGLTFGVVPAGTGVIGHLDKITAQGPALAVVLIVSTVAAIAAGALAFAGVARLLGTEVGE